MSEIDIVIRLGIATLLGGLIGLERELHNQPAGLRTHIIVALGSALVMIVSIEMYRISNGVSDPSRIAAQVVTGIGFLGAGAILKFGTDVKGLTTAACLWTSSAIGLSAGAGLWFPAALVTVVVVVTLWILDKLEKKVIVGQSYKRFVVTAKDAPGVIGKIERVVETYGISIKDLGINKLLKENKIQITGVVKVPENIDFDKISKEMSALENIEQFEID
jgi:putative Mg2+ transporter-C (MgtC) family protein